MAAGRVDIAVGLQDDELKKGIKNIPKQFKKAGLEQFVKLKLDASDFRVQVQQEVKEAMKAAKKAGALTYTNKAGQNVNVDPTAWKSTSDAMKRFTDLGMTHQVKALERLRAALYLLGNDYKQHTAQMKADLDMPTRLTKARNSGLVQAERQRIAREAAQKERLLVIEKQLADVERRRLDNQKLTVNTNQRLQNEIALTQKKLGLLRQIDLIQNGGKPSERTLAEESRLRNLQHTNGLLQQQGGILGRLKGLATQYLSIFAVWNFGKKIADTTGYFEQQKVALEGILGSAADAEKAFTRMQKMALQSPFELKEIVGQTKQAAAYGIGDGDTNKLLEDVKMLGDLSAGLGVDMQRLILAYGQVKAAAVLRGQELRQFTEAGIPMVQALADKFTQLNGKLVTTGEVFELISKRQVSFEMVASVMRDMTAEGGEFNNMQEKITETLYGQMQKLKDMWTQSMNSIGSGMNTALMGIVKILQAIVKHAGSLMKGGIIIALYSAIKKIGPQLIQLKENVHSTAVAFRFMRVQAAAANASFKTTAATSGKLRASLDVLKATAKGLGAIFASIGTAGLFAIGGAIWSVISSVREARREFGRTMADIDKSFNKDLTRMTDGLDSLISKIRTFSQGTKAYNDAIDSLKSNYGEYVNDAIIQQLQSETDSAYSASKAWLAMRDSIEAAMKARNEYERHTAKAEAAGSKIEERATTEEFSFLKFWQRGKSEVQRQLEYINNGVLQGESGASYVDKFNTKESQDKVNNVIKASMSDFFASEGTTFEEFKESVEKNAKLHAPEMADALSDLAIRFFNVFASDEQFDFYKKEVETKANSPYALNKKAFEDARKKAADNLEGRWEGTKEQYRSRNDLSKAYDPFEWNKQEDELYIEAAKTRMIDIYKSITDKMKGEGFAEAGKALTDAFNMDWDTSKTYKIADAMHKYADAIKDPELRANIENIRGLLVNFAGTKTDVAAQISSNIEKDFMGGVDVTARQKDFFNKYNPTDQNVESLRKQIVSEYQRLDAEVKSHKNPTGEWKKIVDDYKEEMKWLEMLAGSRYYDVDLTKNGGSGAREIPDFFNLLKNPYEQYKRATQQGGVEGGIAFMRTNKTIQDMYGGMFGGEGGVDFDKEIGNKTFGEIILGKDGENLIKGGLEDGVLDFRKAGEALANELKAYYKGNKQERGSYLRMAEQVRKWVTDTFTRDAVTQWLEDLQKATKELQRSFEQTSKGIDLYKKMALQGNVRQSSGVPGGSNILKYATAAIMPDSQRIRKNIGSLVQSYNGSISSMQAADTKHTYSPFSLGRIQTLDDVASARNRLENNKELNKAFYATDEGKQMFDALTNALNQLEQAIINEYSSIRGDRFTGNAMEDSIAEALRKARVELFKNVSAQSNSFDKGFGFNQAAGKDYNEALSAQAQAIYDQFVKNNDFSAMANAGRYFGGSDSQIKGLMKKFDDIIKDVEAFSPALAAELKARKRDFSSKEQAFRAESGAFGSLMVNTGAFFGAHNEAQKQYKSKFEESAQLQARSRMLNAQIANSQNGTAPLSGDALAATQSQLAIVESQLATCNRELQEMGVNGENLEKKLRMDALKNIQANLAKAKDTLGSMQSAVNGVVDSAKALSKAINKVYDVMHDGENPAWMQDMDAFLEDFGEAFNMLIAPITAVIAMITALAIVSVTAEAAMTPLLIVMLAIIAAAVIVAAIVAAFQQHDRRLQRSIENIEKNMEALDNAITNLNAAAERQVGFKKLRTEIDATSQSLRKATDYANQALLEEQKKNSDIDKIEEYRQKSQEAMDEYKNGIQEIVDGITSSTSNWAESISSAIRSAFQNGENAVRSFASVAKQMIGDVVETMLRMAILEPLIQQALQDWTNSDALQQMFTRQVADVDRDGNLIKDANGNILYHSELDSEGYTKALLENINDEDKAKAFYASMLGIGDTLIDAVDGLPPFLKDAYAFNADTQSLSGGIQGMTEDTGRTLEGLGNSILMQHVLTNQKMDEIKALPFAQVQTSWFKDMLVQSQAIALATQSLNNAINDVRNGVRPLYVTMQ